MGTKTCEKMIRKIPKSNINIDVAIPDDDLIVILIDKNSDECTICALPEHGETTFITLRGKPHKIARQQEELI